MPIYLPIAEMSVDVFTLLALGGAIGFLSGVFGVGGGFLLTPLLLFIGVPPPIAVASQANQLVAASVSGVLAQWRRGNVDVQIGAVMIAGGLVGSLLGVWVFGELRRLGQIDIAISLLYVVFLGGVGGLMLTETVLTLFRQRSNPGLQPKRHAHLWIHGLPLRMRFRKSKLYISALVPFGIGAFVGLLAAVMGVGGGFIMVPLMIYLLGMPIAMVAGTSLFQIIFVASAATLFHAVQNQTVDFVLAALLLAGGVIGAQFGARVGARLRGEHLRVVLALLVLAVGAKLLVDLFVAPDDPYSIAMEPR